MSGEAGIPRTLEKQIVFKYIIPSFEFTTNIDLRRVTNKELVAFFQYIVANFGSSLFAETGKISEVIDVPIDISNLIETFPSEEEELISEFDGEVKTGNLAEMEGLSPKERVLKFFENREKADLNEILDVCGNNHEIEDAIFFLEQEGKIIWFLNHYKKGLE